MGLGSSGGQNPFEESPLSAVETQSPENVTVFTPVRQTLVSQASARGWWESRRHCCLTEPGVSEWQARQAVVTVDPPITPHTHSHPPPS